MTLGRILEDVKTRMPNAFEEDTLVLWLDTALRDIYKVLALREGFSFTAMGDQTVYPLPGDIRCDGICAVVVGGKELTARRIGDTVLPGSWFKAAEGFIGLYPAPKWGETVTVWYFARPDRLLTTAEAAAAGIDFSTQKIALDPDYAEMLKLALCITIAEAREDVELANNYKVSYNLLLARARQERYEKDGKYPVTRAVTR
ncbi:MAG: hypothetical protein IJN25_09000 [Clostridia bacterium]|nr:hypothetical protein [Clostridia bacterium]